MKKIITKSINIQKSLIAISGTPVWFCDYNHGETLPYRRDIPLEF